MAFMNKIGEVAKNIGDRAGDAVETTKLNAKIASEKAAMGEDLKEIGAFFYARFAAGETMPDDVLAHCNNAKIHADAIADAQAEIERIKQEKERAKAESERAKAESERAKAESEAARTAAATTATATTAAGAPPAGAPAGAVCLACGAALEKDARFCSACGAKVEAPPPPPPQAQPRFCTGCGTALEEGARFCVSCGQKVEG